MKQKYRLASRLYIIATIAFCFAVVFTGYIVFNDIFSKPGSKFTTFPNHRYGYSVPVTLQLNQPGDSTLTYHNADKSRSGEISNAKQYGTENRKMFYDLLKNDTISKNLIVDKLTVYNNNGVANAEFNNLSVIKAEGYAVFNPKNFGFKLLLAVRNYLLLLILLFVLWHTRSFFKALSKEFSFSSTVSRKLWIVGNAILCYQLINWVLCLAIQQYYEYMTVTSTQTATSYRTEMYKLYADTEFNLGVVLLSLSLIVISRLLDYGNNLQEENDLTV